jgi:hypothetical protein
MRAKDLQAFDLLHIARRAFSGFGEATFYQLTEIQIAPRPSGRGRIRNAAGIGYPSIHPTYEWGHRLLGVILLAKGDRDAPLIEIERVNVVDGRQLGLAPI